MDATFEMIARLRDQLIFAAPCRGSREKRLQSDLRLFGLRPRRGHDLRRTMISLVQDDGSSREMIRDVTHGRSRRDAIDEYTTLQWKTVCREVARLRIAVRDPNASAALDPIARSLESVSTVGGT